MPDMRISGSSMTPGQIREAYANKPKGEITDRKTSEPVAGTNTKKETPEERSSIQELVMIEKKVIAHEQAHKSAGGEFTGPATYSYTVGPDGKRYVTGGEVSIKIPSTDKKEDLIHILERVKQAALAPAEPSGQDIRVASSASAKQASLRSEVMKEKAAKAYQKSSQEGGGPSDPKRSDHFDQKI